MKKILFSGAATALITPFKQDNTPDIDGLKELIEFQIKNGIQALIIAGTTGEASTLTFEEYSLLIAKSKEFIGGRIPLIAGSGSNDTAKAIKWSLEAEKRGANGLLIVTPYYNKTTQNGLIRHYFEIANRVRTPIILYNIPTRAGMEIEPQTCKKLADHPNIIGIKEASGSISKTIDFAAVCPDIAIYSGNDDQTLPILSIGGKGIISVLSNAFPKEIQNICRYFQEGNLRAATKEQLRLLPLMRLIFEQTNPIPIKFLMNELGLPAGNPRLPLIPCEGELCQKIKHQLQNIF